MQPSLLYPLVKNNGRDAQSSGPLFFFMPLAFGEQKKNLCTARLAGRKGSSESLRPVVLDERAVVIG
ncbi:MAG: hypothetical protein K0Q94_2339 [Paenibacillus sp.]|nr:hypothetical protein [Paenibacillus sp.]